MPAHRSLPLLICALALVVTGCGADESTPEATAASETPSATPAPTSATTEAATPETPQEFVRRWIGLEREMHNSGDTTAFRELSAECEPCGDLADKVDDYDASGGSVKYSDVKVQRIRKDADLTFTVWVKDGPIEYRTSPEADVESLPGGQTSYKVALTRSDDGYTVADFVTLPE